MLITNVVKDTYGKDCSTRESKTPVEQTPVDIVLNGLRIGRRLHVPNRYPPGRQDSEIDSASLRSVLSKVHTSILSAILEPSEQRVIEFTEGQIWRTYDTGERHVALLAAW